MKHLCRAGVALVAVAALTGCADKAAPDTAATPTPTPTTVPSAPPSIALGAEGLDVRYLDEDGKVRTLRVEDFPR